MLLNTFQRHNGKSVKQSLQQNNEFHTSQNSVVTSLTAMKLSYPHTDSLCYRRGCYLISSKSIHNYVSLKTDTQLCSQMWRTGHLLPSPRGELVHAAKKDGEGRTVNTAAVIIIVVDMLACPYWTLWTVSLTSSPLLQIIILVGKIGTKVAKKIEFTWTNWEECASFNDIFFYQSLLWQQQEN